MLRLPPFRLGAIDLAAGVDKPPCSTSLIGSLPMGVDVRFQRIKTGTAGIALIASGTEIMTYRALALDEAISEEGVMGLYGAEGLAALALLDKTVIPQILKHFLDNSSVVLGGSPIEDVKVETEPVINFAMEGAVLCAKGWGVYAFFEGFCLGGCAVFIL